MSMNLNGSSISSAEFGQTMMGEAVVLYGLRNRGGMQVKIATYGGIVTSLTAPDRHGQFANVVLGYDALVGYLENSPYFGALIGRYGNRIARGRFVLNGNAYTLATNNGANALHGGIKGFDKVVWTVTSTKVAAAGPQLALEYLSRDGEEGYPGNLRVSAVYTLTEDNALRLDYTATTDRDTVVNLTQHTYFNLRGRSDILGHLAQIDADQYLPVDGTLIPTGEFRAVSGTPFDFRAPTAIGARIDDTDEQLEFGKGYDHSWVINSHPGVLRRIATVTDPDTGRILNVHSTERGLQFYSGNMLDGTISGRKGRIYAPRSGFCMEPQSFPDSPNRSEFPTTVLKIGETYRNSIVYEFSTYKPLTSA